VRPSAARLAVVAVVAAIGIGLAPLQSSADPRPPAPTPPVSALVAVADELSAQLARSGGLPASGALVVAQAPKSDVALVRPEELALRVGQVIAGRLRAHAHDKTAPLAAARTIAGRATGLVFVQIELERGTLRVTADVYPAVTNSWERLKNPLPGPRAHGFARAPIDAEIRVFLPPILLERAKASRAPHAEGDLLAVACGDLDGDGGLELVLLSRGRAAVGRVGPSGFMAEKTVLLRDLTTRAAVPFREPLGAAFISAPAWRAGGAALVLGTTDRGGVALTADLAAHHLFAGLPVGAEGLCATLAPDHGSLDGLAPCPALGQARGGLHAEATAALPARFDAISALRYADASGRAHHAVAVREPSGRLHVRVDGADVLIQEGAGAQVLLADLDLDGVPELVTTADTGEDRIVVSSLGAGARARLRLEAKEGVRALGACPAELGGAPTLVAAVGEEVWLVR